MKAEANNPTTFAAREERSVLDEIRNDRELIERLDITPQELQALSKCALLGTLTCKDDMLFILRQIRESSTHSGLMLPAPDSSDCPELDFSECPSLSEYEDSAYEEEETPLPAMPEIRSRIAPQVIHAAPDENVRRPMARRIVVLSLVMTIVAVAAALLLEGVIAISRRGGSFITSVGARLSAAPTSATWLSRLDGFGVLLAAEGLLVAAIVAVVCLRSLRGFSRLKVMPSWRY
jgi:hypothetical protein